MNKKSNAINKLDAAIREIVLEELEDYRTEVLNLNAELARRVEDNEYAISVLSGDEPEEEEVNPPSYLALYDKVFNALPGGACMDDEDDRFETAHAVARAIYEANYAKR